MKFLRNLLAVVLVLIIIGGAGYIGYNLIYVNHSGHTAGVNHPAADSTQPTVTDSTTAQPQQQQSPPAQPQPQPQPDNPSVNFGQQNRDKLARAVGSLNEAIGLITLDPYAPGQSGDKNQAKPNQTPVSPAPNPQVINIYPQNSQSVNVLPSATAAPNTMEMADSGVMVDQQKMQQIHSGLLKLSQGQAKLGTLADEFKLQSEEITGQNLPETQKFVLLHNRTVQNRSRLNESIALINEAATLVNVNPYYAGGGSYESERMRQIHEGVMKLAQGNELLQVLNDDLGRQAWFAVNGYNSALNSGNNSSTAMDHNAMTNGAQTGGLSGVLQSLAARENLTVILYLVLILMVIGLIAGIAGSISSLFKPSAAGANPEQTGGAA